MRDPPATARRLLLLLLPLLAALPPARGDEEAPAYGDTPEALRPYRRMGDPYAWFFTEPPTFRGPGREAPEPRDVEEVRLGVLVPMGGKDREPGVRMRNGVTLALEEANADGGYREGVPFRALYRDEDLAWGAAANTVVDLVYEEGVWGILGALEDANSHVMTRVLLKVEVPMVNTWGPDPTLTEHMIPWLVRMRPDDRQNCYRLAHRIFEEDGHRRVAVFRANDRYARMGIREFVDAARRLQHPILLEVRFEAHEEAWPVQIERLRRAAPDAIVLWGRAGVSGRVLKALRLAGLDQPVYGPDRLVDPDFLSAAGATAEGVVVTYPFDLAEEAEPWTEFRRRYRGRFRAEADAVAAYAYDGTRLLVAAIRDAGLNRPRIRDRLFETPSFDGVMGPIRFDTTHNNVSRIVMGRVEDRAFRFYP